MDSAATSSTTSPRNYVVRAKDAHSWVEAYFPGYGWQTFDPTPGGDSGTPQGWERISLYVDAMASFWRDWIVSYDTTHQYVLGQAAVSGTRSLWENARKWARDKYAAMLQWARRSQDRVENSPARWGVTGALVALILADFGKRWPPRAIDPRNAFAGASGTITGTGCRHVVSTHVPRAGSPWSAENRQRRLHRNLS